MKILVVDDEIMQLKNLKIGLQTECHSVVTAQSAEEALEQVEKAGDEPFDLIITDYLMPNISGLDLLKTLRRERAIHPRDFDDSLWEEGSGHRSHAASMQRFY